MGDQQVMGGPQAMGEQHLTRSMTIRIDEALRELTSRELVSGAEVVDLLLDLRLMLLSAEESQPAPS